MFNAGSRSFLWNDFDYDKFPRARLRGLGTDQAWVNQQLYPKEVMLTSKDGIYKFNTLFPPKLRRRNNFNCKLPDNARLIFFNGKEDPTSGKVRRYCKWVTENWM
jgi:hypothetical protein